MLLDRALQLPNIEIRWKNKVTGLTQHEQGVALTIDTPDGPYRALGDYLVAADGARSGIRAAMDLESHGQTFRDRFLIADVKMKAAFPTERWFWFDPPFHRNQSALLHKQPDDVWRIDFSLGWDADPVAERQPRTRHPAHQGDAGRRCRVLAGMGEHLQPSLACACASFVMAVCCSPETPPMRCRPSARVAPIAESRMPITWPGNWRWWSMAKRLTVLLDTYAQEREYAADENILNSTRSTDFITPKNDVSRAFRNAVLTLAKDCAFARRMVNSGRLSVATTLRDTPAQYAGCG